MLDVRSLLGREYDGRVIESSEDVAALLLEYAQIAVVPGDPFGAPGYCRVSYAVSDARIIEAMRRLRAFLAEMDVEQAI